VVSTQRAIPLHRHDGALQLNASLALRLRVYLTRGALDRKIAAGRPYHGAPALELRARQLSQASSRQQIASSLRDTVDFAEQRASNRVPSAAVVESAAVRRAREPILGLAERLEGPAQLNPAGIARARVLITDGLSPLFDRYCPQTVTQAIYEVQDALEQDPHLGA
jgi:hypothetical protein